VRVQKETRKTNTNTRGTGSCLNRREKGGGERGGGKCQEKEKKIRRGCSIFLQPDNFHEKNNYSSSKDISRKEAEKGVRGEWNPRDE